MKNTILFIAGMLSLVAAGSSSASQLIDNLKAGKDQTVVVYGTSLTAGGEWTKALKAWLETVNPKAKVTFVNSGQSGKNSIVGLQKLDEVVIAKKPDTVLIEFAVNDAGKHEGKERAVTQEQCGKNLGEMIDRIRKALPGTEIILQTMNPAWDAPNGNRSGTIRPDLASYYEVYRKVAAERGLKLIDHNKNWEKIRSENEEQFKAYVADGVHPTKDASVKVTFPEVKKALEE
ncbi:MAG TPA: GDSL-type esterase/lipase family protein [Luteolibacter sp.]|nr:GDSL-type esterase/lipase family protein [Luteolibacter sp.]